MIFKLLLVLRLPPTVPLLPSVSLQVLRFYQVMAVAIAGGLTQTQISAPDAHWLSQKFCADLKYKMQQTSVVRLLIIKNLSFSTVYKA